MTTAPDIVTALDDALAGLTRADIDRLRAQVRDQQDSAHSELLARLSTFLGYVSGTASMCAHLCPELPSPVWGAMWHPSVLVCTACTRALTPPAGTEHVCDTCGTTDPNLSVVTAVLGHISMTGGTCRACNTTPEKE